MSLKDQMLSLLGWSPTPTPELEPVFEPPEIDFDAIFSADNMRARLAFLQDKKARIRAVSDPLREVRDKHVQEARAIEDVMNAEIKAAETGLFDVDKEIGRLAKALGGYSMAAEKG